MLDSLEARGLGVADETRLIAPDILARLPELERRELNMLDWAMVYGAWAALGDPPRAEAEARLRAIARRSRGRVPSVEYYMGKMPTRHIYGSPALTAAFVVRTLLRLA